MSRWVQVTKPDIFFFLGKMHITKKQPLPLVVFLIPSNCRAELVQNPNLAFYFV